MKTYIYKSFVVTAIMLLVLSSCSVHKNAVNQGFPLLNFQMQDMEYIKDVQDTTVQTYILGIIPIGGSRVKKGYVSTNVLSLVSFPHKRGMKNAIHNALKKVPDADLVVPVYQYVQIDKMFLGRREYLAIRLKAFRLKTVNPALKSDSLLKLNEKVVPQDSIK